MAEYGSTVNFTRYIIKYLDFFQIPCLGRHKAQPHFVVGKWERNLPSTFQMFFLLKSISDERIFYVNIFLPVHFAMYCVTKRWSSDPSVFGHLQYAINKFKFILLSLNIYICLWHSTKENIPHCQLTPVLLAPNRKLHHQW
jgi:hypothetical protein